MLIYPAIDILGGKCVRLKKGDYCDVTQYGDDPLTVATALVERGAKFLHVVDLDGAREGRPVNSKIILKIAATVEVPVQVGGGIRTLADASLYLGSGVKRVILGTSAITNSDLLSQISDKFGKDAFIVSLDVDGEKLAINGWLKQSEKSLWDVVENFKSVIVTDIARDGTLEGPNLDLLRKFIEKGIEVIAAGGVSADDDLVQLEGIGCAGAIVGKALYEGRVRLPNDSEPFKNNLAKRIIPCMDIADGRVVKGVKFTNLKDAGDPVELARRYSEMGADELVFLDISATVEERKTLYALVEKVASTINIPFTVGGGITSISDISKLLAAGADKVSLGTIAVTNPEFVRKAAARFGSQCIVISLDCRRCDRGWEIYIRGGREATGLDAVEFAKKMAEFGAGELLINSLDRDGTGEGFDIDLLRAISDSVRLPVIASSGAGCKEDFLKAFSRGRADAGLAASLFHYGELGISELKKYLSDNKITIRL